MFLCLFVVVVFVVVVISDGTKQIVIGGFKRDLEILDSDGHRLPGMVMCRFIYALVRRDRGRDGERKKIDRDRVDR